MSLQRPSLDIQEALIQCCGTVFHYKTKLKALLIRCGVSENTYLKYAGDFKFTIARSILSDLDGLGEDGIRVQHRMIAEFASMQTLPEKDVPNPEKAKVSLSEIKKLASMMTLVTESDERQIEERKRKAQQRSLMVESRRAKLNEIKETFYHFSTKQDEAQGRGYVLEQIIQDLLVLNDLDYHPPYKTVTEQIDGWFSFKGIEYLIEARWRKVHPTKGDLLEFQGKVLGKLHGTRGLFISVIGFRPEVISDWDKAENHLILMDGRDLMEILEDRISFADAIDHKVSIASQQGLPFCPVY